MKRLILAILFLSATVFFHGCCCGEEFNSAFEEGYNSGIADSFNEMSGKMRHVDDSPEKKKVQTLLDKGYEAANEGRYGTIDISIFQAQFDQVVADNEISKKEAKELARLQKKHLKPK